MGACLDRVLGTTRQCVEVYVLRLYYVMHQTVDVSELRIYSIVAILLEAHTDRH